MAITYSPSASFRPLSGIASVARKVLNAIIEARMASAHRFVNAHMNALSDRQLTEYGFSKIAIDRIRKGEDISEIL